MAEGQVADCGVIAANRSLRRQYPIEPCLREETSCQESGRVPQGVCRGTGGTAEGRDPSRPYPLPRVWGCPAPIPGTPWNLPLAKGDGWQDRCSRMLPGFGVSRDSRFLHPPRMGIKGVE